MPKHGSMFQDTRTPAHGPWRHLRANAKLAASTGVPGESILLAENGVSVDLVAGVASIAGAVPVGKVFVGGLITGDVGDITLGEQLIPSSGFVAVFVVVKRGTAEGAMGLEPAVRKVEAELESLAAANVTDPIRIAQGVRRTVGKWMGETNRRQPVSA